MCVSVIHKRLLNTLFLGMNHKTSLVKIKALFGETFLAQQSLDFLGGSSLPEEIDLSYDYLQKLKENNFDVLYVPEVHGVTFTPDVIMGLWERCSPNTTILYNYDDVYKWYTSNKDSFWYKEILPTGWLFMKSVPLEGRGYEIVSVTIKGKYWTFVRYMITLHDGFWSSR